MSGKLAARLEHIQSLPYDAEWKERQTALAIHNAETWDSITSGGKNIPKGMPTTSGDLTDEDLNPPYPL